MTLWLGVRRWRACALSLVAVIVIIVAVGDLVASLPTLFSVRGLELPLALAAPLVVSTALGYGLASGDERLEGVAVRLIPTMDAAYALGWTVSLVLLAAGIQLAGQADLGVAAGRNAVGFTGLLLVGRALIGSTAASIMPAMVFVGLAFFGTDASGEPRWWAWTLAESSDETSWLIVAGLLLLGVAAELRRWQPFGVR